MPWLRKVGAVVENWYPGQVDGDAIAPILFGDVDPSGHLPETFPRRLADGPLRTALQYPGVNGQVVHSERLLVGYRWYASKRIAPLFPFGFGLSYTTFRFSRLSVERAHVSFTVTNTGRRSGADVAQLYVGDPASTGEPPLQLEGYTRVVLAPGHRAAVTIDLPRRAFAYWSTQKDRWTVAAGCYSLMVGDSSVHLPLRAHVSWGRPARGCG
jgi:beta-glucosidase